MALQHTIIVPLVETSTITNNMVQQFMKNSMPRSRVALVLISSPQDNKGVAINMEVELRGVGAVAEELQSPVVEVVVPQSGMEATYSGKRRVDLQDHSSNNQYVHNNDVCPRKANLKND